MTFSEQDLQAAVSKWDSLTSSGADACVQWLQFFIETDESPRGLDFYSKTACAVGQEFATLRPGDLAEEFFRHEILRCAPQWKSDLGLTPAQIGLALRAQTAAAQAAAPPTTPADAGIPADASTSDALVASLLAVRDGTTPVAPPPFDLNERLAEVGLARMGPDLRPS